MMAVMQSAMAGAMELSMSMAEIMDSNCESCPVENDGSHVNCSFDCMFTISVLLPVDGSNFPNYGKSKAEPGFIKGSVDRKFPPDTQPPKTVS